MAASSCGVIKNNILSSMIKSRDHLLPPASITTLPVKKQRLSRIAAVQQESNTNERDDIIVKEISVKKKKRALNFSGEKPVTPILDTINLPIHMKNLSVEELERLSDELREEIVYSVSKTVRLVG